MSFSNNENDIRDARAKENALMEARARDRTPESGQRDGKTDSSKQNSFEEFSGYTTMHGVRFIGDHTSILPRRFLWLLLVLVCGALFSIQVYDRITYFLKSPVTVNFKINYNKTVAFPAITICNQNNFRVTEAFDRTWLQFLMTRYGYDSEAMHLLPSPTNDSFNLPISELFEELAHTKDDFIVRWENKDCSAANFTTSRTSHGLCFTFNKASGYEDILQVQNSGVDHGLRLTLNTEQYEVLTGPHDTTGIKILATDQSDSPLVEEIGLAISSGTHAFVSVTAVTINNLPPPHGECIKQATLKSTERYSPESCMLECKTNYVVSKCGCRHFYMPDPDGKTRLCTIWEYIVCLEDAIKSFNDVSDELCDCPASCYYHIYEPTVSYATSSHIKTDIKDYVNEDTIRDRFYAAKEIRERLDLDTGKQFNQLFQETFEGLDTLKFTISSFNDRIADHSNLLQLKEAETINVIRKRNSMFDFQSFIIQNNFLRGRDAMEDNSLGMACQGFNELVLEIEYKLQYLITNKDTVSTDRRVLYILLQGSLRSRLETLALARTHYTQLIDAYNNGTFILNSTHKDYDWEEHVAIVPRKLLSEALTDNDSQAGSYLALEDIDQIIDSLLEYESYIDTVFGNESIENNQEEISKIKSLSSEFKKACENFLGKKNTFYSEVIEKPYQILKTQQEQFTKLTNEFEAIYVDLYNNLEFIAFSIEQVGVIFMPSITTELTYGMEYLSSGFEGNVSKYDVAIKLTSDELSNEIYKMERLLEDIKRRIVETQEAWRPWINKIIDIWRFILQDEDIKAYTKLKEWDNFQQSLSSRGHDIYLSTGFLDQEYTIAVLRFESFDNLLLNKIKAIISTLKQYKEDHDMHEDFYRKNFLQLDIYFKELRSEQIDQQVAYDEIALLCDIGGSMGLLIGGSVITFFEVVDFLLLFVIHRLSGRRR